jgi:hypothetical protein
MPEPPESLGAQILGLVGLARNAHSAMPVKVEGKEENTTWIVMPF